MVSFHDVETGKSYNPGRGAHGDFVDFAIIVRAHNPYDPDCAVLVLAGEFGEGTQAAMDLVCEGGVEQLAVARRGAAFEVLLTVEIIRGRPQAPAIVTARPVKPVP